MHFDLPTTYKIPADEEGEFSLKEEIYVSDVCTKSFYPPNHPENKGMSPSQNLQAYAYHCR
jgi:hypothetical protein